MKSFAVLLGAREPLGGYIVKALLDSGSRPTCVLIDRKEPSAKDLEIYRERTGANLPPLYAEDLGVPNVFVDNHNADESIVALRDRDCRLAVNAGTPRILSERFLGSLDAVLNCHPGLLPKYRGCTAVEWSVYNDDPIGNTVHLMTAGIDEGPIVLREGVAVEDGDDYVDVRVKVYRAGFKLLARATKEVASGKIDLESLQPQAEGSYWKPIDAEKMSVVLRKLGEGTYRHQQTVELT